MNGQKKRMIVRETLLLSLGHIYMRSTTLGSNFVLASHWEYFIKSDTLSYVKRQFRGENNKNFKSIDSSI